MLEFKRLSRFFAIALLTLGLVSVNIGPAYADKPPTDQKIKECIERFTSMSEGWGVIFMGFIGVLVCPIGYSAECGEYYGITTDNLKTLAEGGTIVVDDKVLNLEGLGTMCTSDVDGDDYYDFDDNCPNVKNLDQSDFDGDGVGDVCDDAPCPEGESLFEGLCKPDKDGDIIPDAIDNCPDTANNDQTDSDHDKVGDACEEIVCPEGEAYDDTAGSCVKLVADEVKDDVGDAYGSMDFSDGCSLMLSYARQPALGVVVILTTLALLLTLRYRKP